MEATLNPESIFFAERVSGRMVEDLEKSVDSGFSRGALEELFNESRYSDDFRNVPLQDVAVHLRRLGSELATARERELPIACVDYKNGEIAPISMMRLGRDRFLWERIGGAIFQERYRLAPQRVAARDWKRVVEILVREEENVVSLPYRETLKGFERSLAHFLAFRFEWRRLIDSYRWAGDGGEGGGSPPLSMVGAKLAMEVSCNTPGLRVHVSPAYFIDWRVFGSPTTPVNGHVNPGRHVFAGDGPDMRRMVRDHGVFHTPPTYHARLTRF